ncbi:hypothetical protein [Amycolatopsis sp. NPDC051128]
MRKRDGIVGCVMVLVLIAMIVLILTALIYGILAVAKELPH